MNKLYFAMETVGMEVGNIVGRVKILQFSSDFVLADIDNGFEVRIYYLGRKKFSYTCTCGLWHTEVKTGHTPYCVHYIAVYGAVDGEPRRIQMWGSPKDLYQAMIKASRMPPKKRFLTVHARELADDLERFLSFVEEWDDRPEIES